MPKYDEILCLKCNKITTHRIRNKYRSSGSKGKGPALKYQAKHCLVCNFYHGYSKEGKKEIKISLK